MSSPYPVKAIKCCPFCESQRIVHLTQSKMKCEVCKKKFQVVYVFKEN